MVKKEANLPKKEGIYIGQTECEEHWEEFKDVHHVSILGKPTESKKQYVEQKLTELLQTKTEEEIRVFYVDFDKSETSRKLKKRYVQIVNVIQDVDPLVIMLEAMKKEIQGRIAFLDKEGYNSLKEYDTEKGFENPYYEKPPIIYVLIQRLDYIRQRFRDRAKDNVYLTYLDKLLEYIMKWGVMTDVGIIVVGTDYSPSMFPTQLVDRFTLKIGVEMYGKEFNQYFRAGGYREVEERRSGQTPIRVHYQRRGGRIQEVWCDVTTKRGE